MVTVGSGLWVGAPSGEIVVASRAFWAALAASLVRFLSASSLFSCLSLSFFFWNLFSLCSSIFCVFLASASILSLICRSFSFSFSFFSFSQSDLATVTVEDILFFRCGAFRREPDGGNTFDVQLQGVYDGELILPERCLHEFPCLLGLLEVSRVAPDEIFNVASDCGAVPKNLSSVSSQNLQTGGDLSLAIFRLTPRRSRELRVDWGGFSWGGCSYLQESSKTMCEGQKRGGVTINKV